MSQSKPIVSNLEHINLSVSNVQASAKLLCELFDWRIRWQGRSQNGGYTIHVGNDRSYLALYTPPNPEQAASIDRDSGSLNHIAIVVDDLDEVEDRVKTRGLHPFNHGDYEPGRRFYFLDEDRTEFEIVTYAQPR